MKEKALGHITKYGYYMSDDYDLVMDILTEEDGISYVLFKKIQKHCIYNPIIMSGKLGVSNLSVRILMSSDSEIPEYISNIEKIENRNKIINDIL